MLPYAPAPSLYRRADIWKNVVPCIYLPIHTRPDQGSDITYMLQQGREWLISTPQTKSHHMYAAKG